MIVLYTVGMAYLVISMQLAVLKVSIHPHLSYYNRLLSVIIILTFTGESTSTPYTKDICLIIVHASPCHVSNKGKPSNTGMCGYCANCKLRRSVRSIRDHSICEAQGGTLDCYVEENGFTILVRTCSINCFYFIIITIK